MLALEGVLNDDGIIAACCLVKDHRRVVVCKRGFGCATLSVSPMPPLQNCGFQADSWGFPSPSRALKAMEVWGLGQGTLKGWHSHLGTGRYRIDGDEHLEYVKGDRGTIEDRIISAVKVTQGQDLVIREVREKIDLVGSVFPAGTRCFNVISESSECTHDPRCQWIDQVYHYLDRCVVLSTKDLHRVSVKTVLRRLTEEHHYPPPTPPMEHRAPRR